MRRRQQQQQQRLQLRMCPASCMRVCWVLRPNNSNLPDPRKPLSMVTGVFLAAMAGEEDNR